MHSRLNAAIYGTITVGALLAIESARQETYPETLVAGVIALVVYWLAHTYADFASDRLEKSEPFTIEGLVRALSRELWIFAGAALPFAAVLIDWAVGATLATAINVAIWTSAGTVVAIEVAGALRAKQTGRDLALQITFGALMGLGIIALRLVLH
jgi:hypothetical protein